MWILRLPASVNNLEDFLQRNGFSPQLILRWILRLRGSLYGFKHSLSTECVLRWILRLPASVNNLGHSLQVNGFSPECALSLRSLLGVTNNENDLEHSLQAND